MSVRAVTYTWRLREVMAAGGVWKTTDLLPLLAERGGSNQTAACQDAVVEPYEVRVKAASRSVSTFRPQLEKAWEVGFAADISLADGTDCSAVLITVSSTALILDRCDPLVVH
jgi:hypothetical protein